MSPEERGEGEELDPLEMLERTAKRLLENEEKVKSLMTALEEARKRSEELGARIKELESEQRSVREKISAVDEIGERLSTIKDRILNEVLQRVREEVPASAPQPATEVGAEQPVEAKPEEPAEQPAPGGPETLVPVPSTSYEADVEFEEDYLELPLEEEGLEIEVEEVEKTKGGE